MRLLFTMAVSLYTSRVVLRVLGEEDFGTYSIVGGVVVFFTFISNAMATGTQRHLSYELGKDDGDVPTVFSACFRIQVWLALMILVLAETVGLWFLNSMMNFPEGRMMVVNWIYQFSILSCLVGIIQTPLTAAVISYERMSIYAYLSILDVLLKLGVVFLIQLITWDKLLLYGALVMFSQILMAIVYALYVLKNLSGIKFVKIQDNSIYKHLLSFSGWSLFGSMANVGYQQGINIIINLFYGVVLNAAVGIANQINGAVSSFVSGFQQALNPQLVQTEASKDRSRQTDLIYKSSKFSFFIVFIIAFPLIANISYVLKLWLGEYPAHTESLSILVLAGLLISCLSGPLWVSIYANGNIRAYQIVVSIVALSILPISYFCGSLGSAPEVIFLVRASNYIFVLIVQLFFLKRYIGLKIGAFIKNVLIPVSVILISSIGFFYIMSSFIIPANSFWELLCQTVVYVFFIGIVIWIIGLNKRERQQLVTLIMSRVNKRS